MKFLFGLLTLLVLNKECDNKNTATTTNTDTTEQTQRMANSDISQDVMTITYEANTRGFYEKVWITQEAINTTTSRNQKSELHKACPKADWDELMRLVSEINIADLASLEAPSKAFQYDGAAMATLKVTQGDTVYTTPLFDHGNPPKTIAKVVKKVLSLNEMIKKQ